MNEKFVAKKVKPFLLVVLSLFLGLSVCIYFWDVRWQPQKLTKQQKSAKTVKEG